MDEASARLTHVDESGAARMVDVTGKAITLREAEAKGTVSMSAGTVDCIREDAVAKGDVLAVARVAGIMAAKRASEMIPLCHSLPLGSAEVRFELSDSAPGVHITARVGTSAQTGVEMEALTAVTIAALTIYDMCKAIDKGMRIGDVRVTHKAGGRSGTYRAE